MTTVQEAINAIGYRPAPGCDVVLAQIFDGVPQHRLLDEVAGVDVATLDNLYLAGGTFHAGAFNREKNTGRTKENLAHIHVLTFDCDLATFFPGMDKASIYAMSQPEIDELIPFLVREIDDQLAAIGLQAHGIDYTGHGIVARINLASVNNHYVDEIQKAQKRVIARINKAAGIELVDKQTSDAGTRIFRLVPTRNTNKKGVVRQSRTIRQTDDLLLVDRFVSIANADAPKQPVALFPVASKQLGDADARAIIEAVQPHWNLGQKHALSLALAGMLAKAGVPEEQARQMVEYLSADDTKPWDRAKTVESSYQRVKSGQPCRGFYALRDVLPLDVCTFVDARLASVRQATAGTLNVTFAADTPPPKPDKREGTAAFRWDPIPDNAIYGITKSYVDLVSPTTEAPRQFHVGSWLTVMGAMIGRRVSARFISEELYANLYTLLYGPSGTSRKDTAIKRAMRLPQITDRDSMVFQGAEYNVSRNISSSEGMIAVLKDKPNTIYYLTEFSSVITNARRKGTSTILDTLIEAWDTPSSLENLNKMSPQTARNPYVSFLTATQPGRLSVMMTDEDIISGFANRWLYIPGDRTKILPTPPDLDERAGRAFYLDVRKAINSYPEGTTIPTDDGVRKYWDDWYRGQQATQGHDEDEDAMRIRHATLIFKLALINAVGDGERSIRLPHVEAAIAFIEWMWANVRRHMRDWGVTKDVQIENRIRAVLERKGIVPRRILQQQCKNRKWSSRDFNMAFDSMKSSGELAVDTEGKVALYEFIEEAS